MENKETRKENGDSPEKKNRERTPLTEAQRLKRQKMIVLPAMVLVFIGAMWLIFAPSSDKEEQPGATGYNTEIPDADKDNRKIIGDKVKAYEQGEMEERRASRNHAMQELGSMFDREVSVTGNNPDFDLASPGGGSDTDTASSPASQTIRSSATAYRDLNATLGNFYEQPSGNSAEMEELMERISYMGGQNGQQTAQASPARKAEKHTAMPVKQVTRQVVSSLAQPMSNAEFAAMYAQERNMGFHTAVGSRTVSDKNTISACVYGAQSVTDGQAVRLRLLEPMAVAEKIIPRNAILVGAARIQGERLGIAVTSLEHEGTIIPVELSVYDTDGQEGIFIPNSMEMNAVREVAANMGGSLGSSINISTDAKAQLASDLGKGLIQGTSQYIAKKMRTVKVHLKAGYKVMLYQDRN